MPRVEPTMTAAAKRAQNPLRTEGVIVALRGTIITLLGVLCLVQVSWLTAAARHVVGTADLIAGVLFLVWGLAAVARGLVHVFQYDGFRYLPASLSFNLAEGRREQFSSSAADLRESLLGRRYLYTPQTPNVLVRVLYSFFPGLIFLIPPLRSAFENLIEVAAGTLVAFFSFALAWFSIAAGVAPAAKLFWFHLMMTGLLLYVAVLWIRGRTLPKSYASAPSASTKRIALILGISAAIPLIFWLMPVSSTPYDTLLPIERLFPLAAFLAVASAGLAAYIIRARIDNNPPPLNPTLLKKTFHESVHPSDIFTLIRRQDPAGTSLPNRLYQNTDDGLFEQGGSNRGVFSGDLLFESEPTLCELRSHTELDRACLIGTISGESLIALASILLYFGVTRIGTRPLDIIFSEYASYAFLLWVFGSRLAAFAHHFWSEVFFSSYLVCFHAEGSYEQSKVTAGAAWADTLRSENKVVRSKIAATLVCGRTHTATLARYGTAPLNYFRFITAINQAPEAVAGITSDLESLLAASKNVAVHGHADVASILGIQQFNEAAAQRRNVASGSDIERLKDQI